MKRGLILAIAIWLCLGWLVGCQGQSEPNIVFEAVIESVQDRSLQVTASNHVEFDKAVVHFSEQLELDFVPESGQLVELTILPVIAESYPVQVTAVQIRLIAQPTTVSGYPISRIRTHQIAEASLGFLADYCDNAETFIISRELHLPAMRFETKSNLTNFIEKGQGIFDFNASYNGPSFVTKAEQYNDTFFEEHTLVAVYITEGSGSIRHTIESIECRQGHLRIEIEREVPDVGTADMAYWFILIEVPRSDMTDCNLVDAIVLNP